LELAVQETQARSEPSQHGEWWPLDRLDEAGLPTLFAKAARLALA
jgi:A/G-specific adenine glycosylase